MNKFKLRNTVAAFCASATIVMTWLADNTGDDTAVGRHDVEVRVVIENLAPAGGTWLTPVWVGFHDGTFDTYDFDHPASAALERIAEDGNTAPLMESFADSGAGDVQGTIIADMGIPPIAPGETATMTFMLDRRDRGNRYFSYASMVIPSNDAFIANGNPRSHRLFRARLLQAACRKMIRCDQATSKRSRFITRVHAATKSRTNASSASPHA